LRLSAIFVANSQGGVWKSRVLGRGLGDHRGGWDWNCQGHLKLNSGRWNEFRLRYLRSTHSLHERQIAGAPLSARWRDSTQWQFSRKRRCASSSRL
jgi:hypothetical protein